jgi:nucleoside-diphosphate-sugar epimerase
VSRERLLITGANGRIGTILRERLAGDYDVTGIDFQRDRGSDLKKVDAARLKDVLKACAGHDVIVDLAAIPAVKTPWEQVYGNNVPATVNALEAARLAGCRRVVFASSNHVVGLYERDEPYASIVAGRYEGLDPERVPRLTAVSPLRPDGYYALGKVIGEAAGRFYAEEHGLSVHCLRIGSVTPSGEPTDVRCFATLLTHDDLERLVRACIEAPPDVAYGIFYGVSANTWRFWDIEEASNAVGYEPRDNAESWR